MEDPVERLRLIAAWTVLPDLVTANQGEQGILEVCELLVTRGVGIEAGLLSLDDARQSSPQACRPDAAEPWCEPT